MTDFPENADIETASDDYASRFSGEVGEYFLEVQLQYVLTILKGYGDVSILDVGGGHAQLSAPLINKGYNVTVTGSDDSCKKRLENCITDKVYGYETCNMLSLPFENNSFDVVLAFRLLPHVSRWKELIVELSRVAKKAVIVDYPDIRSTNILNFLLFRIKKQMEGNTRPFLLFSRQEIGNEFNKNALYLKKYHPQFLLPMVVHRKLRKASLSKSMESFFQKAGVTSQLGSPIVAHFTKKV
ncbi:MAG: class I SAM-dependent methyltransferase [Bacteroidetes bacterium]|nr:class I SAM-dependent methyltransferase [Bacteroidota bacterium]